MDESVVFEGALRIAQVEYPRLDAVAYRALVSEFAREARPRVPGSDRAAVERLNDFFFGTLGFHGNTEDYYDPRNSFLNDVIDRRTGIPITLSAVYCEIARRLELPACGVGFPGHFLVKCRLAVGDLIVDCFSGKIMTREDCRALHASLNPARPRLEEYMLEVAPPREILARMLNNLRHVHAARREYAKVLRWIDMDLELRPDACEDYRDRGMIHLQLEQFGKALEDLETYACRAPDAPDLPQVREQIQLLRKLMSRLN